MAPLTSRQRAALNQFMEISGASETVAKSLMKKHNYVVDAATNAYLDQQSARPRAASSGSSAAVLDKAKQNLATLFDSYRDAHDQPDETGFQGTLKYLQDLGVNMEDASGLIPFEIVQSPALGVMKKQAFVDGWTNATSIAKKSLDTIPKQATFLNSQTSLLSTDRAFFKRVYRYTFICSREAGQKAMPLENAIIYWRMLFTAPSIEWKSGSTNWLDLWIEYLEKNWTKTVSKDMWNQTAEFALKSLDDEALSFYSEEGAWPSVIDDFVAWIKGTRGLASGDKMQVD